VRLYALKLLAMVHIIVVVLSAACKSYKSTPTTFVVWPPPFTRAIHSYLSGELGPHIGIPLHGAPTSIRENLYASQYLGKNTSVSKGSYIFITFKLSYLHYVTLVMCFLSF
jgi:hypothetical protein